MQPGNQEIAFHSEVVKRLRRTLESTVAFPYQRRVFIE